MLAANLSESMKNVVRRLYQDSLSSSNLPMKAALYECLQIMESSREELAMKILQEGAVAIGKYPVQYLVENLFWGTVKKQIRAACPEAEILLAGYKAGRFASNLLSNTDKLTEQYGKMVIIRDLEALTDITYGNLKLAFIQEKTPSAAQNYLSAVDFVFSLRDQDCVEAYRFIDAMDQVPAIIKKIFGTDDLDKTKEALRLWQTDYVVQHEMSKTAWIDLLEEDYPNTGLYEKYVYLQDESLSRIIRKEFVAACPVDVSVYDANGELVGAVEGDQVFCDGELTVIREGELKRICFYDDADYRIVCNGTDTGTMDLSVSDYNADGTLARASNFYDVPLENGTIYQMEVQPAEESGYTMEENDGSARWADYDSGLQTASHSVSVENGWVLTVDGQTAESDAAAGETLMVAACIPSGYRFLRWESLSGEILFEDEKQAVTTLRMPDGDLRIRAVIEETDTRGYDVTYALEEGRFRVMLTNSGEESAGLQYLLAVYDGDGRLMDTRTEWVSLAMGETAALTIPWEAGVSDTLKAFILTNDCEPLRSAWTARP